ncbi:hypothetical protein Curi_c04290 [Gottschalkia acidurici 9a]|uniref:Uncharacterized protein n=1 Tax=Gottschalkia acidurici (strain ATCC 7906 / DSM 604 / BCRC 14475 / CIP 104303 / KCTC 5404 / NCIMB 10678 / 9a) TaxID=1128398 RepID=K0AWA8_GOTA9|nr:hypothetical protein [Gottschalkia acidurici]AFS77504.1 hypothetical protein Curi_c04290 [Gottschalkia acidurici 9a]
MFIISNIIISLLLLAGVVILQIFLSQKENKWLGLILPIINVILSIMVLLGIVSYSNEAFGIIVIQNVMLFLMCNIPTMILLAIYFGCRKKFKKNREIDKMNIQDL